MKYSPDLKEKVLNEVKESTNISAVAKKHNIPDSTIHTWLSKMDKNQSIDSTKVELRRLRKELLQEKAKVDLLEDLLKKTHHLWVNE